MRRSPSLSTSIARIVGGLRRDCLTSTAALLAGEPALPSTPRSAWSRAAAGRRGAPRAGARRGVARRAPGCGSGCARRRRRLGSRARGGRSPAGVAPDRTPTTSARSSRNSTRVCDRLACCPPGPPDGENDTCSSWRGIRTERVTGRTSSTEPDCHDLRSNGQGRPRLPRGARRGRPGDATVIDRGWASTLPRRWSVAGAERTSVRRGTRRTRRPRHAVTGRAGSEDRLWNGG